MDAIESTSIKPDQKSLESDNLAEKSESQAEQSIDDKEEPDQYQDDLQVSE